MSEVRHISEVLEDILHEMRIMNAKHTPVIINETQTAELLGVTRQTVRNRIANGKLRQSCINGRKGILLSDINTEEI